jgi:putative transposon-encoded protein
MTKQKQSKLIEVEHVVKPISNGAHVYLPIDWIGKNL